VRCGAALVLAALALLAAPAAAATIKIGTLKLASYGPVFIADEKGYFAAEGITPDLVFFESAEPIAVAVVSGALDFGVSGTSGGLYSLAGQGALKIIAAGAHEAPGFRFFTLVASNRAYAGGLTSFKDLSGRSVAVSQIGSPSHYSLALVEEKYRLDPATIRVLPLQSLSNQISAVSGNQVDATIINATSIMPVVQHGDAKLVGFVGDEVPWQVGAVYTATKTANDRHDLVERFLAAYRKGAHDYHAAFVGADGKAARNPTAPAILAILAKYTGQPAARLEQSLSYIDADARLDEKDILHQIAWYKSQNMLKGPVEGDAVIDKRYAVALPQ
jgi:NitT/TauT family transport system substrate-binding protein